ncbi:SET and MYND domain-containing protein 4-like [Diadema antillarum]|uniref:SET and MYND domain-containing protein 4-like n=1 Tax=Diadema antillarum TaxID=105358 RepID=UPI003A878F1F
MAVPAELKEERITQMISLCNGSITDPTLSSPFKSAASSEAARNEGNRLFQKKDYLGALQQYTRSVQHAPCHQSEGSQSLALAHANRSAALYHLGEYKPCINDIDESLAHGYPIDKRFKVLSRKGQCFMKLGRYSKAKQEIKSLLEECNKASNMLDFEPPYYGPDESMTEKIAECSSKLVNASAAVRIRYQKERGRYLVAESAVPAGRLIIREKPFASVVLKDEADFHCHGCYVRCLSPIPCLQCTQARYCCDECRTEAWDNYHSSECAAQDLLEQLDEFSRLSLRILLVAGKAEVTRQVTVGNVSSPSYSASLSSSSTLTCTENEASRQVQSLADPPQPSSTSSSISSSSLSSTQVLGLSPDGIYLADYHSVCHLEARSANHKPAELCHHAMTSIFLAKCFHQKLVSPVAMETLSEDDLINRLAQLLFLHARQLKINSHAITEVVSGKGSNPAGKSVGGTVQETSQVRVGTAVYPTASLMNHACEPNVIASFHRGILSIRTTRDISRGEEIQHCYGPHARRMPTAERQRALIDQYGFRCDCKACSKDQQPLSQEMETLYKCPGCGHPLYVDAAAQSRLGLCAAEACGKEVSLERAMEEEDRAVALLSRLDEIFNSSGIDPPHIHDLISKARSCLGVLEGILVPHHMSLATAYDFIGKCHAALGEFHEAGTWLSRSLPIVERVYGSGSVELAHELFKLAQIHFNGKEVQPALSATNRALELFMRHYGNSHEDVIELMEMKACLMSLQR